MKYRKSVLSASIVTCLAFGAQAQDASPQPAATDLDTIQVVGIRGALEKSLDTKREASSHVEAVSAEDIGKLPAKNVADTLRELPGVNIASSSASEGAFDEADRVSLRGTAPSLTQTTLNGHGIATGDWFVLSQVQTVGRSVSYSLLPSEIVDQVVVHKSSEAKLVEGGAAGSIDIITRKPLQFDKPFTLEGSVGAVYSDLPGDTKPQFSGLLNWKNDAGNFGVLLQPFFEKRSLRRDGQEVVGGYGQIAADAPVTATNPDLAGVYYPNLLGATLFEQERERKGGTVDIQFKPSDSLTLDLNGFTSEMKADNYNRNYMIWGSQFVGSQAPDSYTVSNGVLTNASYSPNGTTPYGVYDMISRPGAKSSTNYISLNADWMVNDAVDVKFEAGTSHGEGKSPHQDVLETGISPTGGTVGWQMNGLGNVIDASLGDGNTPSTQLPSAGWIFGDQGIDVKDKEDWFAADSTWSNSEGVLGSLDFGVRYTEHERHNDSDIGQGPLNGMPPLSALPTTGGSYPSDFGDGLGGSLPSGIWYYTPAQLAAINAAYANRDPVARFNWQNVYGVKEKNGAAYVQANFIGDRWSGNIGLRYVNTSSTIHYNQGVDASIPGAITGSAFGAYLPIEVGNDYSKLLPSANFKFDFTDTLVGRVAASKTLTRPDYSALAGYVSLDDITHTGSGGNPYLKPLISSNFDASLEWYFAPRALLAASAFYMKMKDYIDVGGSQVISYKDQQASYDAGTDIYSNYLVTVPVNTDAKVKGLELTYQQPIGEHFGFNANYTYTDGDTDTGTPMFGTSKNTYNVAGYFENDAFSARLSYSYRDSFYAGASRATPFYQDDFGTLSASLGWKVTDYLSLSLDALNLNNPKSKYYTDTDVGFLPYAVYSNGRQYYLNARFKF
jgi:iron complex outermembrane recepter protein